MKQSRTIGFLTYDWAFGTKPLQPNGCAWYRCLLPMRELQKYEWRVGMGFPQISPEYGFGVVLEKNKAVHGWNIVVLKLIMREEVADAVKVAQNLGQKVVVDVDDFFEELEPTNRAYASTDPKRDPKNNREHYARIIDEADAVITSTPFLFNHYAEKRKNVYLVRNGIDIERWKPRRITNTVYPTIGWVGATPWRSRDLEELSNFMNKYLSAKGLKFHHSGHTFDAPLAATQLNVNHKFVTTSPMMPISHYPQMFNNMDIGIVPLSNVPFNYAKSYIKGLEYAASGIPFVASPLPEYLELHESFVGRVASTAQEWVSHFNELLNPAQRKDDAEEALDVVREKFTMQKRGVEWNDVMTKIYNL